MRWTSSALVLALLASGWGCSNDEEAARELAELERALTAISAAPVEDWPPLLEQMRRIPLTAPKGREVRAQCLAAYEAYTKAAAQLREARKRVESVETETRRLTDGDGGIPAPEIGKLHREATEATDEVGASLDRAQRLVDSCRDLRAEARAELGSP